MVVEDELAATKAAERKARLAQMMENAEPSESSQRKPGAIPGLSLRTKERNSKQGAAGTAIPVALSNLESKLDDRRGQVSRLMNNNHTSSDAQNALSRQEQDLLAKSSGKVAKQHNSSAIVTTNVVVNALQGAFNPTTPEHIEDDDALDTMEANVLSKRSRNLPNAPPVSTSSNNNETPYSLKATIVDDSKEREKITREAQQLLISQAVVATEVEADDKSSPSKCMLLGVALIALLAVAAVLGGVCGTGNCRASSSVDEAVRAQGIVELINSVSSSSSPIELLPDNSDTSPTPEQEALMFLVENDPLRLSAETDAERIIQRYALVNIWYTNGPWSTTTSTAPWFAVSNECQWDGVVCEENVMTELNLDEKKLTGSLPPDLALLTALTALRLSVNVLNGNLESILDILGVSLKPTLEVLDLSSNQLTGSIPGSISEFTTLKELYLAQNIIDGVLPESLTSMTQLEVLNLSFNSKLGGAIPTTLASFTALTNLGLAGCDFDGTPPDLFTQLTNLEVVAVGDLPSFAPLAGLSKLTSLAYIGTTPEGGTLPSEVGEWWPNMEQLLLPGAGLSGSIPSSIAQWSSMKEISLTRNAFTGTFPEGAFPAWASTMSTFFIERNNFGGRILENIGLWSNLEALNIGNNDFTGSIPTTVGALTNIQIFQLSSNGFTGTLPTELLNFPSSFLGRFEDNNFTGVAPFCLDSDLLVAHSVDCLEVTCSCCSGCL